MQAEQQRCLSFTKAHGCWLHQGLEQLQKQAGLWHWSASSPPPPPEPGAFGLTVQRTAAMLVWSFQFYRSDLSPGLTLMLIPSLVDGAADDIRDKCFKMELGSFWGLWQSLRGWGDGVGKSQIKRMPESLGCVPGNLNACVAAMEKPRHPFQDHCLMQNVG